MSAADDLLVQRCRQGDPKAFNLLIRRWERSIYNFIFRLVGQHEDAQDLCQETFLRAYQGLDGLKDASRFRRWIYTIAANVSRDRLKRRDRRRSVPLSGLDPPADGPSAARPAETAGPDAEAERAQLREIMTEALQRIPESQRLAVLLRTYHGFTTAEIAELTGDPPGTIRSRIFHGLRKLHVALKEMGLDEEEIRNGLQ